MTLVMYIVAVATTPSVVNMILVTVVYGEGVNLNSLKKPITIHGMVGVMVSCIVAFYPLVT